MAFQEDTFQQDLIQIVADSDSTPLNSILGLAQAQLGTISLGSAGEHDATSERTTSDTLGLTDVVTRIGTFLRTSADGLTISDAVVAVKITPRSVSDALGIADTVTRTVTLPRSVAQSLTLSDAATRQVGLARSVSDALAITDVATVIVTSGAQEQIMVIYVT